jgi:hypothetical protein
MLPSAGGSSIRAHCPLPPHRPLPPAPTPGPTFEPGQSGFPAVRGPIIIVQHTEGQVEYHLGVDGGIYQDGKPIKHLANATIDEIEQSLAEIVVKNHLDPELFKDDDTQS